MSSGGGVGSGGPIKRSEELARKKMDAQKSSSIAGRRGDSGKVANEAQDKQASSERHQQREQEQQQREGISSQPTAVSTATQANKLVFGLNPRAHRPHSAPSAKTKTTSTSVRQREDKPSVTSLSESPPIAEKKASNLGNSKGDQQSGQSTALVSQSYAGSSSPTKRSSSLRGSKYGNFYKPQDLIATTTNQTSNEQTVTSVGQHVINKSAINNEQQANKKAVQSVASSGQERAREQATSSRPNSVRSTSRSPDRSKQMARRKSFDEDISTIKTESSGPAIQQQQQQQSQQLQQQPILKTRTQFNILPPPQMVIATTGKGSVVGYAKSRIYDRPVKQILANPPESTYSLLDDRSGQIPASILSGFKPPKQVNVSKAREKWEGGEPFAKCKSRKRLAAQANKKLFPGTWSMTSVVATQQLHLQQALAQSASSANHRSNPLETDPSVKVLTRGSVLERVQQFEKVPSGDGGLAGGGFRGTGGCSSGSLDSLLDYELGTQASGSDRLRSSSLSSTSSLGSDGGETVTQQQEKSDLGDGGSSKQAQYKSRVSSIQQQQRSSATSVISAVDSSTAAPFARTISASPAPGAPAQQRRLSLRRRSSIGLGRSSTESLIPKFYHPNGKPNTYEIEIRKRNIVACFERFPERRAQLEQAGTTNATSRKQFHQIALACGYSEYFKVPLQRFVLYKLETDPKLSQMSGQSGQAAIRQRKSSTIALNTNGTSSPSLSRPLMTKAASVESTTPFSGSNQEIGANNIKGGNGNGSSSPPQANEKKETCFVSCEQFLACWRDLISCAYDNVAQFIHLLTLGQRNYLTPDDFVPLVQSIIDDHPGLKFLRAAPDFHMRYIQTVIARIYFNINRSWTGKITLQELRKSNLLAVLQVLGQEEDINQITDYFSYEHFYVIYCKFWNLDQDHDLFISKEDLARHNDAAISSRIIERIFSGIVSKQIQKTGRMSYSDFVWFLIAEEDKKHPRSIEYWFRLMDLDGDGYISMYEMEYFYYEQTKRLELMNIEALPFLDSACQILDLVNPREKNKISLADLKRTKMATIFFDTFINLEKYLEHESREFVSTRDIVQGGVVISDWDRYASEEYESLVTEESTV